MGAEEKGVDCAAKVPKCDVPVCFNSATFLDPSSVILEESQRALKRRLKCKEREYDLEPLMQAKFESVSSGFVAD